MLIAIKLRSHEYIIYPYHITYKGNLHVFNHYNIKAFLMKTNAFTLILYLTIPFLDHNKVNNLYYSRCYLFCVY